MNDISPGVGRLCRLIRLGSIVFVVGVLAIYFVTWFWPSLLSGGPHFVINMRLAGLPATALAELSVADRMLIGAVSLPYLAALIWAFYRLDGMLRGFERGEFFERATVGHLRAFSGYLLLAKLLSLLAMHARVAALVHLMGHEHVRPVVNLSSDDMSVLLMCALFFLIARMMEEGRKLAEENREFV
ncbi:MAG: DUF2975 domain-containing protein [Betaproteobacteria bacterium]